jgi:hypothetical protein
MRKELFHGIWRLNIAASMFPFPAPRSVVLCIEVEEDRVRFTEDSVSSVGVSETAKIEARFDNEAHPIIGSSIADGFAIRRVSSNEWETRGFKGGKAVFSATLLVSEDERSFREFGETTLDDGRRANVSLIYERCESETNANGGQEAWMA